LLAAEKAVLIAQNLVDGTETDIDQHIEEIRMKNFENTPGPSTSSILREAASRDIPLLNLKTTRPGNSGMAVIKNEFLPQSPHQPAIMPLKLCVIKRSAGIF
jgi:cyanophycin synthetase